jgi:hypothetical protein
VSAEPGERAVWRHRRWPCEAFDGPRQPDLRVGQPCRVLARGRNGNVLVEFDDGARIVGVRYCVTPPGGSRHTDGGRDDG